jgi:hypothetical protein
MPHNHPTGWSTPEIYAFADSILKDTDPLPQITGQGRDGRNAWVTFSSSTPIQKAELNYTVDDGEWPDRQWQTEKIEFDRASGKASAILPENTTAYFINLTGLRGLISSSRHESCVL